MTHDLCESKLSYYEPYLKHKGQITKMGIEHSVPLIETEVNHRKVAWGVCCSMFTHSFPSLVNNCTDDQNVIFIPYLGPRLVDYLFGRLKLFLCKE